MNKSSLIGISILSFFILCSLTYQPIIAEDKPIVKIKQYNEIIEEDDCGCENKLDWGFPVICAILYMLQVFSWSIKVVPVPPLWMMAHLLAEILDCPLTYP